MIPAPNGPALFLPRRLPLWLLPALLLLAASCNRRLTQRDSRYHATRGPARPKATRAPLVVKSKTKAAAPGTAVATAKTVTRTRLARPSNASGSVATVIEAARGYQGTPYLYGGTTRAGLDCSGLLLLSFAEAGIAVPRSSNEQAVWGEPIKPTELRPGDLLFFGPAPGSRTITHVGLVTVVDAEGVEFIHASTSLGVVETSFESDYYLSRFVRAVRPRL